MGLTLDSKLGLWRSPLKAGLLNQVGGSTELELNKDQALRFVLGRRLYYLAPLAALVLGLDVSIPDVWP